MQKLRYLFVLLLLSVGVMSLSAQTPTDEPDPQDAPPELVVVSVLPEDGTREVAGRAVITVIFNRPVVPLVIVEDMDDLPQPLTITPAIDGVGEWLNTSIYTFTPNIIWSPSTLYTIMVNAGLTAIDGTVLAKDVVWSFTTAAPRVIEVRPSNNEREIALNRSFQMTFNMPMDTESVESAFFIRPGSEDIGTVAGTFEWNEDNSGFRFTPTDLLIIDTQYKAGFDAGYVSVAGGGGMNTGFTSYFNTVPYPEIIGSEPRNGTSPSSVWEVSINFNVPMNVTSFEGLTSIDPAPDHDPDLYFHTWNNALSISFPILPSTEYTITLAEGGQDSYGNTVGSYEFSFTSPPYPPQLGMRSADVGFYNANNPQTQLFITHLNVSKVNLDLYQIPFESFARRVLDEDNYDPTYRYSPPSGSLIRSWEIESVAPPNLTRFELLNLGEGLYEDKEALDPGIYFLNMNSPETQREGYDPNRQFIVVGSANLTTKMSIDGITVWATDIQTGEPIPNAPIVIYDTGLVVGDPPLREVGTGTTDADGMLYLNLPRTGNLYNKRIALLDDGTHYGVGLTTWSNGIESYNFGVPSNYYPAEFSVYLYTDRPIYRPDQPVYFRGVIRDKDDVTYTPYGEATVPVQIYDDAGEIIYDKNLPVTEFGTFSDTFDISAEAGLGSYRISVELPSRHHWYSEGGSIYFAVAEYRLPEFMVENAPVEPEVVQGGVVQVDVSSRYFFGGLVSNARVNYTVVSEPYNFPYKGKGYYSFYDFDPDGGPSEYYSYNGGWVADGEGMTDEEGRYLVEIPADLKDATQSQVFRVETTITDESQQAVSNRTEVVVHKGEVYVGVRPQGYVGTANTATAFEFVSVDWDSNPVPNQELTIEIVERRWSSVQEEDSNGRTIWTWEQETIPVTTGTVTTDENGVAVFDFIPPNGGIFKATAITTDSLGNEIRSAATMWVSSREYVSWRQQNSNRIDLIASQNDFAVGDEAEILITSPFQGSVEALITVERGDVLTIERVTMDSNSYIYKFPILPEYAPNVYVTVLLIKGVDENNLVAGFRMGVIALYVDIEQKELTLDITSDVEQAAPGETVTYTVRTTNYLGEGVSAEVGVGLTDLASLSISSPNSVPLLEHFYSPQGMGVLTAMALTINTDQITREVLDTIKGGGGGPGEGGIFDIREEFVDTAYWNATVVTDENGVATFEVVMPDNLTTWRLDARAVTSGNDGLTLVGQNTFDLISTRPLLIRPVTTRFFVVGDVTTLSAVVNNNTNATQTVFVEVLAEGVTILDSARQTVEIASGGRARITWQALVEDVRTVNLTFFAMNEDGTYTDASKPPLGQGDDRLLPVYRYEVPEIVGTGGFLRGQETITEGIMLPSDWETYEGELTLQTDHSLASSALDSLRYLRQYTRYGTEALVSSFLPNIMVYRAIEALNLDNRDNLRAELELGTNSAIQALYGQQKIDGGWGWYYSDDSDPNLTAWVLISLQTAKDFGFTVSDRVIQSAQRYLTSNLITPSLSVATWQLNRQAFMLYALAYSDAPNIASMSTLYDSRERMSIYAKTLLARALHLGGADEARMSTLISDVMNVAILSANGAHWEESARDYRNWNTDTRTTAMVLGMLTELRPDNELIPNIVRYLMVMRRADAWSTTQETAWSLMALTDWMVISQELEGSYDYTVTFNGDERLNESITPRNVTTNNIIYIDVAEMLRGELNRIVIDRTDGTGNLYYTAYLRVNVPVNEVEPLDRGIIINRRYTLADDETNTPITQAQIGELVRVRLTIIIPNSLHYVVIEDPFPAGAEAVNPNLLTSQQIGTRPELNLGNPLSRGWGWWYFSNIEFYDEKAVLSSTYLPAGTYEYVYTIRPGLEGVYNVIPPIGYEFFFPDVYGRGAGSTFTVLPTE